MRRWMKPGILAGAVLVALIAAGAAAVAMRGDDAKPAVYQPAPEDARDGEDTGAGALTSAPMCVELGSDCGDMVVDPGAAGDACPVGGCRSVGAAECPPGTACIEPWLQDPPVCPEGVDPEECKKRYGELPANCAIAESFPEQVVCKPSAGCAQETPLVDPQPADAPAADDVLTDPAVSGPAQEAIPCAVPCLPVPLPMPVEPAPGDTGPLPPVTTEQIAPCYPPECTVGGDAVVACPPDKPCGGPATDDCLPPDCAVSSDGNVTCPQPVPCNDTPNARCIPPECEVDENGGVSCPGSPPVDDPACADGETCIRPLPIEGGGSGSSEGSVGGGNTE